MPTRREFLKTSLVAGTALALFRGSEGKIWAYAQSPKLRKFVAPLPGLGPTGIPVATPATSSDWPGADFYQLSAQQFTQQMHPDLPNPTHLWGYVDTATGKSGYLGPIIVAQRGKPVVIRMQNNLPSTHILPVDTTLMGAEPGVPVNRCCVHLHGGYVPWTSDGGPFTWFSPTGVVGATDGSAGPSFLNGVAGQPGTADYYYPNNQSERLVWYHDHAMGITRLNAYAGMAAGYVITDPVLSALTTGSSPAVPPLAYTIPLILQDKSFKVTADQWGKPGDLFYPYVYEAQGPTARWDLGEPVRWLHSGNRRRSVSFLRSRSLFRHAGHQRHGLSLCAGRAAALSFPGPQWFPGALLQSAALLRIGGKSGRAGLQQARSGVHSDRQRGRHPSPAGRSQQSAHPARHRLRRLRQSRRSIQPVDGARGTRRPDHRLLQRAGRLQPDSL